MRSNYGSSRTPPCHLKIYSSASPVSKVGGAGSGLHMFGGPDFGASEQSGRSDPRAKEIKLLVSDQPQNREAKGAQQEEWGDDFSFGGRAGRNHGDDEEKDKEGPDPLQAMRLNSFKFLFSIGSLPT